MSDKKIIIVAVILSLGLIGAGWYYGKDKPNPGPAAITTPVEENISGIVFGDENAPVTMETYTNFLCPACGHFALNIYPKIQENYVKTGKVKMVFYIFPPYELGKAAFCAQKQGKFLEFHDKIFAKQSEIQSEENVFSIMTEIGLDMESFHQCYNGQDAQKAAESWLSQGEKKEVEATPTFFINGQKVVGALEFEEFQKIIDEKLK
ncbi:MAG: thioredoxin domain-containing protein [Candidatus Portnoybacteria bacterium]|nr:thioredoxin domain-containing protein [Candidatus Portnoybacteria bacterium]